MNEVRIAGIRHDGKINGRLCGLLLSIIFCVSVLSVLVGYQALNNSKFSTWIAGKMIRHYFPNSPIESLTIAHQQFRFPSQLDLQNIQLTVQEKGSSSTLRVEKIFLGDCLNFFSDKKPVQLEIAGLDFSTPRIKVQQLNLSLVLTFDHRAIHKLDGHTTIQNVEVLAYQISQVASAINGNGQEIRIQDMTADFYNGKVQGHILLEYRRDFPYSIELKFTDVDLKRLQETDRVAAAQIEGMAKGMIDITGDRRQIRSLATDITVEKDAKIRAALLDFLSQYIPPSRDRQDFDLLVKTNGMLPLELASVDLKSVQEKKFSGTIHLHSRKLNVNLNLPLDINTDGGVAALFSSNDLVAQIFQNLKNLKEEVWKKP